MLMQQKEKLSTFSIQRIEGEVNNELKLNILK